MCKIYYIIIDCLNINYLDVFGVNVFGYIFLEYNYVQVKVFLVGCFVDMIKIMI